MQTKELEPCPFCGSPPSVYIRQEESLWSHAIVPHLTIACVQCDGAMMTGEVHDELRAKWNTRLPTSSGGRGEAWRPIECAPRDGTFIDVSDQYGTRATDARWNSERGRWEFWLGAWDQEWCGVSPEPTHWMPLPSSPSQGGGEELGSLPPIALPDAWRPIESAPKDRTAILAVFRADIYPALRPGREDLQQWNGVQAVLHHAGLAADGFDVGWAFAAPVGNGGFPDEWIAGWKPLDTPPTYNRAASAAAISQNPENVQGEA